MWKFWIRIVRARERLDSKVARTTRFRFRCCARSPKTGHMRLPCACGGGTGRGHALGIRACIPPPQPSPASGGGSAPSLPRVICISPKHALRDHENVVAAPDDVELLQ